MLNKADYVITKVHYNDDKVIDYVMMYKVEGTKAKSLGNRFRNQIVDWLNDNAIIYTLYNEPDENSESVLKLGEKVGIYHVKGKDYIRTDPNETEEDNLGELPEI